MTKRQHESPVHRKAVVPGTQELGLVMGEEMTAVPRCKSYRIKTLKPKGRPPTRVCVCNFDKEGKLKLPVGCQNKNQKSQKNQKESQAAPWSTHSYRAHMPGLNSGNTIMKTELSNMPQQTRLGSFQETTHVQVSAETGTQGNLDCQEQCWVFYEWERQCLLYLLLLSGFPFTTDEGDTAYMGLPAITYAQQYRARERRANLRYSVHIGFPSQFPSHV